MSVRKMTVGQLNADLEAIMLTWPDGIPEQQQDRINAIKGELKRRGADEVSTQSQVRQQTSAVDLADLTEPALEKELRRLSEILNRNSKDEAAQERFAEVRYELRKRQKVTSNGNNGNGAKEYAPPPLAERKVPRQIETPQLDIEVIDSMKKEAAALDQTPDAPYEPPPSTVKAEAKNGMLLEHIEQQHLKVQLAQTAAICTTRLLEGKSLVSVSEAEIEEASFIGMRIARSTFEKAGLL